MELKKALNILELKQDCTMEDLKKAYKKLIMKYHPDKNPKEKIKFAEEKTKELNEAKLVVSKYLKEKTQKTNNISNKEKYIQEFNKELNYINSIDKKDKTFALYKNRFIELITTYSKEIAANHSVEYNYIQYKNEYNQLLIYYLYESWKNTKIPELTPSRSNFEVFKLENTRNKMIKTIDKILEQELTSYKVLIFDYNSVKPLIDEIKDGFVCLCLWGYMNIEKTKQEFNKFLLDQLIKYKKRIELVENLKKVEKGITPTIKELYNNIFSEEKFYNIYNQINTTTKIKVKLKQLIKK